MNAVPFDTLKMAQRLEAAGFSGTQAAGAAEALAEALVGADLATKADISDLRTATGSDISALRIATGSDISALRSATSSDISGLRSATSSDISALRTATSSDIFALRTETRSDMAALEAKLLSAIELLRRDMTIKLGGMLIVAVGVLLAGFRYLPPHP